MLTRRDIIKSGAGLAGMLAMRNAKADLIAAHHSMIGGGKLPYLCELEWLESSGTQWIDTGWIINSATDVIHTRIYPYSGSAIYETYFGVGGTFDGSYRYYEFRKNSSNTNIIWLNGTSTLLSLTADNSWHEIELYPNKAVIDGVEKSITSQTFVYTHSLFVFARHNYNGQARVLSRARISEFQIYRGTTLVRDFIPVLTYDYVPCMYDKVTRQFFMNAGIGDFVAGPRKGWVNPYIIDGLVAMWDGEWNACGGVHDASATTWRSLIGGYNATVHGAGSVLFDDDCVRLSTSTIPATYLDTDTTFGLANDYTLEVCFQKESTPQLGSVLSAYQGGGVGLQTYGGYEIPVVGASSGTYNYEALKLPLNTERKTISISASSSLGKLASYLDGELYGENGNYTTTRWADTKFFAGIDFGDSDNNENFIGNIYGIRVYSRALTAQEVAANYAVDKARFNLP